ncbi:hypothetical protein AWW66_21075 [Micromonospora rosaria]|uniref:Cas3 C-terminal domain-containing protein n=1 Tax=Micromonospora rosaria TaxID=47874 RepID=A0A136PNF5_9ACTN|nr:hypothetical protein [Micromonospora rosaria]KXK60010.1 hypothetical protein AWW66_21075 [Micromonospora rosaria]
MDEYGGHGLPDDRVDVVVLRVEDGRTVPVTGKTPVDLAGAEAPGLELLADLLDSTVRVTAGEGNPSVVLERLRAVAVPPVFAASPWLADSRPVVVRDGAGEVAGLSVRYSDVTGLRITDPDTTLDLDDQDG